MTSNHAPYLALKPIKMLKPPKNPIIPQIGTIKAAKGTPLSLANVMVSCEKWPKEAAIKIAENNILPKRTTYFMDKSLVFVGQARCPWPKEGSLLHAFYSVCILF